MKIVLLRHGKPKKAKFKRIKARNMSHWIKAYNTAELDSSTQPTQEAIQIAHQCNYVITSDLKRSIDSAQTLNLTLAKQADPLFQEFGLPYRKIRFIKLSPKNWTTLFRISWFLGFSRNSESYAEAKLRATTAADQLIKHAVQQDSVLLVGHGFMNRYIAKELTKRGWNKTNKPTYDHWGYGVFEK